MIAACSWLTGLIDEPHETGGLAERRRKTTPAQRAENARQLVEREVKERLNARLPVCADRSSGQAKGRLRVGVSRPGEAGIITVVLAIGVVWEHGSEPRSRVETRPSPGRVRAARLRR